MCNIHSNARTTPQTRKAIWQLADKESIAEAARVYHVHPDTAGKWYHRGERGEGFEDKSSKPDSSPNRLTIEQEEEILVLRKTGKAADDIKWELAVSGFDPSTSTIQRVLVDYGMNKLSEPEPKIPARRFEMKYPGELIHLDFARMPKFAVPRKPGEKKTHPANKGLGVEQMGASVEGFSRLAFANIYPDQKKESAVQLLEETVAFYRDHGIKIYMIMTDNGSCFRSKLFRMRVKELGIKHQFTPPYTPRRNGKVERWNRTARESWANLPYETSEERNLELPNWLYRYNCERRHHALAGQTPLAALAAFQKKAIS